MRLHVIQSEPLTVSGVTFARVDIPAAPGNWCYYAGTLARSVWPVLDPLSGKRRAWAVYSDNTKVEMFDALQKALEYAVDARRAEIETMREEVAEYDAAARNR
ncbi:hypothetical protein HMSP1_11 [Sinorhizobium phage HMSP1-Susan]|nr:hypothetical protein HMSP1_11 [Sinorhizobium phage HMSP1-Susan]